MNNSSENQDNIIILNDEDGNEMPFEFLDLIGFAGKEYIVLIPTDEDADEVVILEVQGSDDDEETYVGIEDPALLNTLFGIFKERNKNKYNFTD